MVIAEEFHNWWNFPPCCGDLLWTQDPGLSIGWTSDSGILANSAFGKALKIVCTKDFKLEVKTVTAGHNITLTCPRQSSVLYPETYYWIRLVSGKWPEFLRATFNSMDDISKIRHIQTKQDRGEFLLEINEAWQNDTGLYYCIKVRQLDFSFVKGTLLKIEGKNVNVVLQNPSFGPHHAGNPEALQCSVLSNSERSTCPADNRVYWFRAGSDDSHPSLLYLQGNSLDECEKSLEAPSIQKCFYNFSETVDPGTYYCAVAACGQILFGSGAKLNGAGVQDSFKIVLYSLCTALMISLIVTFWLIYKIKSNKCGCCNDPVSRVGENLQGGEVGKCATLYISGKDSQLALK
ncbi:uncharacterized protein LOC119798115 [Cyprinodon tularosa]|uniref:uncharacterized protein LOC119798115 n=1 Tax=Cyprinodon tularosa TaxID=77115 RepID=UPI0018E24B29|nr:uncharacterized protein LOC119798115 [Cyprinodon tularosa]